MEDIPSLKATFMFDSGFKDGGVEKKERRPTQRTKRPTSI